jgi:predicted ATPase
MASLSVFVGRQGELEQITSAAARGETVLVTADAGGGTTRLVQELTARLEANGWSVWAAGCLPLAQRLPLLPVIEVLRQQHLDDSGDSFRAALDHCPSYVRDDLARVMPELGSVAGPVITENWQQQRLFAAVTRVWQEMAVRHPAVVVIEDLHWSDETTRDFLTYAIALGPSLPLVLTTRTDEPARDGDLRPWLRQAARAPTLMRVVLGGLSRDDVRTLADAW